MAKAVKKTKKRNPQDATMRNVRARSKVTVNHEQRIKKIELQLVDAWRIEARVTSLEAQLVEVQIKLRAMQEEIDVLKAANQNMQSAVEHP